MINSQRMIISRPKIQTVFSLTVFTTVILVSLFYFSIPLLKFSDVPAWRYFVAGILLLTASLLLHKLIFDYKIIKISHDRVHIYYPFRFFKTVQDIKALGAWQQTIINTKKSEFRQLKLVFVNKGYVKISNQENSEYDKIYQYIKRKAPKKEVKD